MHRKLTTTVLIGLAASVILGATAAHAQAPTKKQPVLVDKYLHIKNPQALVGPNWEGKFKIPQSGGQQFKAQR